jgi:hypothetical protein
MLRRHSIAALLIALLGSALVASAAEREVVVRGMAAVINGDRPAARDRALEDAKVKAVEQVAGAKVTSETVYHDELYEAGTLKIDVRGVVVRHELKREWEDDAGLYHVEAAVVVDDDPLVDELIRLVRADRVVVVAYEPDAGPAGEPILEDRLGEALDRIGYRHVVDVDSLGDPAADALANAAREGDAAAARRLGVFFLADAVVFGRLDARTGQSMSDNVHTASATGSARAFRTSDGKVVAQVSIDPVRGFGRDPILAARDARQKAATQLAEALQDRLTPNAEREIDVVFYDVPDFATYQRIRALLEELRWVNGVRPDPVGFHPRKSVLKVRYAQDPTLLGAALDRDPYLETLSAGTEGIEVRVIAGD